MRTGIMGGTFNPIHNAHLIIARYAKEQFNLDRVIFMTSGNPPHKNQLTDKHIRYHMTKLAAADEFEVSRYEVDREEYSYTLTTLKHLQATGDELFFIIGEDSLDTIDQWYKPEEISKLCTLLVFPRNSANELQNKIIQAKTWLDGEIFPINAPIFGLSSTEIRQRIKEGKSVKNMLPDSVLEYITENNLYK